MKSNAKTNSRMAATARTTEEQQLWDNIVLNLIQRERNGADAALEADDVIRARRAAQRP